MEKSMRLEVLENANLISRKTVDRAEKMISIIENDVQIDEMKESDGMFITHLAVALERVLKGEAISDDAIDDLIYQEVLQHPKYQECKTLVASMKRELDLEMPEVEWKFIQIHLCNLLS